MFCEYIGGWFDFDDVYSQMVDKYKYAGATFVEVGSWLGKSTCFMAETIRDKGAKITFYAVDTWAGTPDEEEHQRFVKNEGGDENMYLRFLQNMRAANVFDFVRPIKLPSIKAAQLFPNQSLDFVYIDAGHTYEDVKADILAWLPKVKTGGTIAGHDYNEDNIPSAGLVKAVKEVCGYALKQSRWSWIHEVA